MRGSHLIRFSSTVKKHIADAPYFNFLSECFERNPEIDMTSAIPISGLPSHIVEKIPAIYGVKRDLVKGISGGDPEHLNRVKAFFNKKGIPCQKNNVSMHHGILESIAKSYNILGLKKSGKVIVPTPTFGYYFQQMKDEGVDYEILPTTKEEGFLINPNKLDDLASRTEAKVLLMCYPNNPTGVKLTRENAEAISEVVKSRDLFVISDEVFIDNKLSVENEHCSIASIDGMLERSLTLTSLSKIIGLPSVRTGICVGPENIISRFKILRGYSIYDQNIITSAIENVDENMQFFENDRQKYLSNIQLVKDRVTDLNDRLKSQFLDEGEDKIFVKPFIDNPEAGNVYLLDFSGLRGKMHDKKVMNTGLDVAQWLLRDASVGTVPGECSLFDEKEMLVRIALGHPPEEINKAFDNICGVIDRIQKAPKHLPKPIESSFSEISK